MNDKKALEEKSARKLAFGFIRNADRCGNCRHFKQPNHCSKGAFSVNSSSICKFHTRDDYMKEAKE